VRWQNGKVVIACEQKDYAPEAAAISPDGHLIASGAGYDGVIRIWNANTGAQLRTLEGHFGRVDALAFTPDGSRLISGAGDTTVLVWDATKLTREQDTGAASGVR
jgi:WD40 repeat protein